MNSVSERRPFFSVVIPTYKRPDLLPRAINSVLEQHFSSWEIIVSDDEEGDGETWRMLQQLSQIESRVKAIKNSREKGQIGNTNSAVAAARGTWIKPLHDDDYLNAGCLDLFHRYIASDLSPSNLRLVSCHADVTRDTGVRRWNKLRGLPLAETIDRRDAVFAMYLHENVGGIIPSCICLHRSLVFDHHIWMPSEPDLYSGVDCLWFARLGSLSDLLVINQGLVTKQAGLDSITGKIADKALDHEGTVILSEQYKLIPEDRKRPKLHIAVQAYFLVRAAQRLFHRGNVRDALLLTLKAWHPAVWWLALRHVASLRFLGLRATWWLALHHVANLRFPGLRAPARRDLPDLPPSQPLSLAEEMNGGHLFSQREVSPSSVCKEPVVQTPTYRSKSV